jgi:Flp pilus assembly protein TadD
VSGGDPTAPLRARLREVTRALERAETGAGDREREWVRGELVSLVHEAEEAIRALTELRDEIRPLVERYKRVYRGGMAGGPAPGPARVDHLGASTHVERGWSAIAGEDFARGERELRRALELAPGDARAEALLGWALMRQGRVADARWVLEGVLAREPGHDLALTCLGYVCLREGRAAEAVEILGGVLHGEPGRMPALYANLYLGMVYAERGMHRDAAIFLGRAIELGPGLAEAYWELGRSRLRAGDLAGALEVWRRGAEANRFNPWGERCKEAVARMEAGEPVFLD